MFVITACLFIPIRSSFSVAPLNTGVVYFHRTNMFPNHAGINVVWNFFKSLSTANSLQYPSDFFPADESAQVMGNLMHSDSTHYILRSKRPNIILIIMESFTAKIIEPLGGMKGVAPNFNRLFTEGVAFTNLYSSGDRTDKGIVTILSGYPAQTKTSIIKFPEKTEHLPFLPQRLKQLEYHPTFVYGGDIGFANMESYLTMSGFDHITEDDDFDQRESKWGVHDGYVFDRLLAETDTASQPFFKVMLALSSHEPFDVPHRSSFYDKDEESQFLNACHYSDSALGAFIENARRRDWWNNTLIIVTTDHGHRYPQEAQLNDASRFHIPMIWIGGAIARQDTTIRTVMSQTDIASTLLSQLQAASPEFTFSKNILSPQATSFAVYVFNNGYGFIDNNGLYRYDFDMKDYLGDRPNDSTKRLGHAYMQTLFSDYNQR
ncbi:MAG: LTA synthase family protein [Cyclobacteriaceae bacterium]